MTVSQLFFLSFLPSPRAPPRVPPTCRYGQDRRDGRDLAQLLAELGKLEGLRWIRLLYCYPSYFSEELIDELARNPKVRYE